MRTKLLIAFATLALLSCKDKKKDSKESKEENGKVEMTKIEDPKKVDVKQQEDKVVEFSTEKGKVKVTGTITNKKVSRVTFTDGRSFSKDFPLAEDGTFSAVFEISEGYYMLKHGQEYARLFLEVGDEINVTLDTELFDETVKFTGKGSEESNFVAQSMLTSEGFFKQDMFDLPKDKFEKLIGDYTTNFIARLDALKGVSKAFYQDQKASVNQMKAMFNMRFNNNLYIKENLAKGMDAPSFENFTDFNGGTKSLSDFKGKYVYIDFWATWCGPCKYEFPFFKKLVEKYKSNKKIVFVAISNEAVASMPIWKKMVTDKQAGGVQLFSKGDVKIRKDYRISSIPRFVLIDPNGKIVDAQAPRPSNPSLIKLFDSLGIK